MNALVIATIDGNLIVDYSIPRDADNPAFKVRKISTMSSALVALGDSIAKEAEQASCNFAILENEGGRMIVMRISKYIALATIADGSSSLGLVLSSTQPVAKDLKVILECG